jgi:hypothetical protein
MDSNNFSLTLGEAGAWKTENRGCVRMRPSVSKVVKLLESETWV